MIIRIIISFIVFWFWNLYRYGQWSDEDDDDINLESFGDELDAPSEFRDKNHPIHTEDEDNEDEDDDNDASGGAFGSHDDIDFNFLHDKWGLGYQMSLKT